VEALPRNPSQNMCIDPALEPPALSICRNLRIFTKLLYFNA
jgi:hypothetical protein